MKVLDIDLDFFLSNVAHRQAEEGTRLPSEDYVPWDEGSVRCLMENQLGLSVDEKIPAILCVNHDEVIYHCEELVQRHELSKPFDLVHVDAHADMGVGDDGWEEILERAAIPETTKRDMKTSWCECIGIGNYISYMALMRMLSSLTYIHNPSSADDVQAWFLDKDQKYMRIPVWPNNEIEFEEAKRDAISNPSAGLYRFEDRARREPQIPFVRTCSNSFSTQEKFDMGFLAQSPNYTPKESDQLIQVIGEYLDFEKGRQWMKDERFNEAKNLLNSIYR